MALEVRYTYYALLVHDTHAPFLPTRSRIFKYIFQVSMISESSIIEPMIISSTRHPWPGSSSLRPSVDHFRGEEYPWRLPLGSNSMLQLDSLDSAFADAEDRF